MVERKLDSEERSWASFVFEKTLDPSTVRVSSSTGIGNRPYVSRRDKHYTLHMGPTFFANLYGYVWNPNLSVREGVKVRAWIGPHLEAKAWTDVDGLYVLKGLQPGAYRVQFEWEYSGYPKITTELSGLKELRQGELVRVDAVLGDQAYGLGRTNKDMRNYASLAHELTHVWQGQHGVSFIAKAASCQIGAAIAKIPVLGVFFEDQPYKYVKGADWDDCTVEQQAGIVEQWIKDGCPKLGYEYACVRDHIRKGRA